MSEYTFKNLNEIDNVSEPADGTTVMGFENGTPIQMPMSAIKGSSGGVFIIDPDDPEYDQGIATYGNKIKEALLSGKQVWYFLNKMYYTPIVAFYTGTYTAGVYYLAIILATQYTTTGLELIPNTSNPIKFLITL